MSRQLTMGSLFAGIGGFDLGFERAGFKTIWQVEIEDYCRRVLARHFPDAERFGDIRECGSHNLDPVDVITGGFPCQDVSQNRTNGAPGLEGERSGLWSEMLRIICELRPRCVVVENVSALLYRGIGRVLGELAESGYDAEWDCIPAAAVGAPHIRDRVFILAYPRCELGSFPVCRFYGCNELVQQGGDRGEAERGQNRKLIALVPGVHSGVAADWWRTQSRMARSADGIPDRLDRLHGVGNAVVPQIAEWIARRLAEHLA